MESLDKFGVTFDFNNFITVDQFHIYNFQILWSTRSFKPTLMLLSVSVWAQNRCWWTNDHLLISKWRLFCFGQVVPYVWYMSIATLPAGILGKIPIFLINVWINIFTHTYIYISLHFSLSRNWVLDVCKWETNSSFTICFSTISLVPRNWCFWHRPYHCQNNHRN